MGIVEITLAMSLDGYVTGPEPTKEQPMGRGGDAVGPGGERYLVEETMAAAGAVVAGRAVHDIVDGWGDDPPFRMPTFVPTHRPRPPRTAGATTFTYVPDVATAVELARKAAGDKNVVIMGGASTADQALALGLVDELNLHIWPVLLGGGTRLFAGIEPEPITLERTRLIEGPRATHVSYRVIRPSP
jgi:dihydrofolate reductase